MTGPEGVHLVLRLRKDHVPDCYSRWPERFLWAGFLAILAILHWLSPLHPRDFSNVAKLQTLIVESAASTLHLAVTYVPDVILPVVMFTELAAIVCLLWSIHHTTPKVVRDEVFTQYY